MLAILSPGDLAENNVLEFLIEGSDIALDMLYVAPDIPFPATLPDHDLAMVAVCETDRNRPLLKHIETLVEIVAPAGALHAGPHRPPVARWRLRDCSNRRPAW